MEAGSSDDNIKLSAYVSPKGDKLVVVAINTSDTAATTLKLRLGSFDGGKSHVFATSFPDKQQRFADTGSLGEHGTLFLAPHSIASVEIIQ